MTSTRPAAKAHTSAAAPSLIDELEAGDGQIHPDGDGFARWGINSKANPDIDLETLDRPGATQKDALYLAVPAAADYTGINVGGTLRGQSGLSVGSIFPATVAIVDASGNQVTSFGGSGGTASAGGAKCVAR